MANIDQDLQAIMEARYGRDVRKSIHDAIRDINTESSAAKEAAETAQDSAINSANKAEAEATLAESYTKGGTGTREGEDTDNAEYYLRQTEHLSQGFEVIDSLESTSPYHPLSAKQGNVLDGKISTINGKVGNANGIASLDSTGRIPYSQLPESAMEYKGTWNANTNTPTLVSGEGVNGDFYVVSVAGTWNSENWAVGDRALFDDITAHEWVRLPAGEVQSVNGKVGAVQLDAGDIPFNKGSSPLTSNDTNSAILEVLQKAGVQVISTTMADYLAHKVDYDRSGAIINITDTGVANSAGNVSYNNTESHLLSTTTQGAIDEVKGITDDINSKLSWTLLGTSTGSNTQNLPNDFNELHILVCVGSSLLGSRYVFNILKEDIVSNDTCSFRAGNALKVTPTQNYEGVIITFVNRETVKINAAYSNSTDTTSTSTMTVYYR